jgi:hypothetical protein
MLGTVVLALQKSTVGAQVRNLVLVVVVDLRAANLTGQVFSLVAIVPLAHALALGTDKVFVAVRLKRVFLPGLSPRGLSHPFDK